MLNVVGVARHIGGHCTRLEHSIQHAHINSGAENKLTIGEDMADLDKTQGEYMKKQQMQQANTNVGDEHSSVVISVNFNHMGPDPLFQKEEGWKCGELGLQSLPEPYG
jgi:hypothetical protein